MDVRVLGPLRISAEGAERYVELAPKPRTLLAVLVAHAGGVVPVSTLVRELWEDAPPASALRNIHTYIFQSRKVLSQLTGAPKRTVTRSLLTTRPGGYVFGNDATQFDHCRYRELVTQGHEAIRKRDYLQGVSLLERALAVWRGPAFVDVQTGPVLEAHRRQLEDSRIGVIEVLSGAKIAMGRFHEAVADLAAVVYQNPLHEGLHYQYIRALTMVGDRAHALNMVSRLRANMVSELGIEPSDSMRELQSAILNSSGC